MTENVVNVKPYTNMGNGNVVKTAANKINMAEGKRAVLGDLRNRQQFNSNAIGTKKTDIPPLKNTIINLKDVKARIDTHWQKPVIGAGVTRKGSKENLKISTGATIKTDNDNKKESRVQEAKLLKTQTLQTQIPLVAEIKKIKAKGDRLASNKLSVDAAPIVGIGLKRQPSKKLLKKPSTGVIKVQKETKLSPDLNKSETKIEPSFEFSHSTLLLSEVDNIDSKDDTNPVMVAEYVNEIYSYLFSFERQYSILPNHLNGQEAVTPKMRAILLDWLNEVHFQYSLVVETYHMTVSIIDRYLQTLKTTSKRKLQLVGVAAIFLAAKYEELYPPEVKDFVFITDDTYTKHEILKMEQDIFKALNFNVGKPLPIHFLRRFSKAAKSSDVVHMASKYFLELASVDYDMAHYNPSQIAAASLFLSLKIFGDNNDNLDSNIWTPTLHYYSRYSVGDLKPIVKQLAELVQAAPNAKLKSVYRKYQHMKFDGVSAKLELYGHLLEQAIND